MRAIFFLFIFGIVALIISSLLFVFIFKKHEIKKIEIEETLGWPMFKHDVYRSGNLFPSKIVPIIVPQLVLQPKRVTTGVWSVGSNAPENYADRKIIEKNDTFDPSPIFVDLDLDGIDEIITYYKNTVYNITTGERPFKDFIMAVKYKENPSEIEKLAFGDVPYVMFWRFILPRETHTSFAASDLNNDNYPEIAFGCDDGNLYVLDKDGKLVFNFKTKDKVRSTPAIADIDFDDKPEIIFGSDDGNLYVLSNEGKLKWSFKTKDKIESSPAIFVENKTVLIAFGSDDGNLYVLDGKGELICKFVTNGKVRSSPLIYNDKIIFGSDDQNIYILNLNCNLVKKYVSGGKIRSSPALYNNKFIIGSEDGKIYFFDEREIKSLQLSGPIFSTPTVVSNGVLVSTYDGKIYLVNEDSSKLVREISNSKNFSCSLSIGNSFLPLYSCFFVTYDNEGEYAGFFATS